MRLCFVRVISLSPIDYVLAMSWLTDAHWGFAGVVFGILLTTLFGFIKSAVERRWTRQDQSAERLFEHRQAAHLIIILALNKLPADPLAKDLREALDTMEPAVGSLYLYASKQASQDAVTMAADLASWEESKAKDPPWGEESDETLRRFHRFTISSVRYRQSARRDLDVKD